MNFFRIRKFQVNNFRNLLTGPLDFSENLNCFFGNNGNGKTNLLEALYIFSNKKSFRKNVSFPQICSFSLVENPHIYFFATLEDHAFQKQHQISGKIGPIENEWYIDGSRLGKKNQFPNFKSIIMTPFDAHLFFISSKNRRDWFDRHLSKVNDEYRKSLQRYGMLIKHRNNLLKIKFTLDLLQIKAIDREIAQHMEILLKARHSFIQSLSEVLPSICFAIFGETVNLSIKMCTEVTLWNNLDIFECLQRNVVLDQKKGHTTYGVHLDDYEMIWNGQSAENYASTGQQKVSYFSLLFAYTELFRYNFKSYPIVLIDDITSELDTLRWKKLIDYVLSKNYQTFISTTSESVWEGLGNLKNAKKFLIKNGEVSLVI
ncbi:MAG: DNA replication/repair protein RecF [Oligoflexia bacterium]|nr:DNA replication/repair protein RecF [Oligoflexia bacterium]